jgi:uncharacterized protein (TIGR02268 family)
VERHLTLPGPKEPAPQVRVAAGVTTYLRFDAPIDKASLEVQAREERFHLVDAGEHFIALTPSLEPAPGERLSVKVRYRGGTSPGEAAFWLVTDSTQVDKEVEVRRPRAQGTQEAQPARCAVGGPAGLVLSGRLDLDGVRAQRFEGKPGIQNGLEGAGGVGYRAGRWGLVAVRVRNLAGQTPWVPVQARLTRADGTRVKVLSPEMDTVQLAPGEGGIVAVETEAPFWEGEDVFQLELADASGTRRLLILGVRL